ncbi:uncharacterized protein PG998_008601 [Apiospora kogelbergensis]|uniref:uncharacterized protein n=1 Tax=Apiospora kogelbergensis TaxID=1337665 RepID=UPI00312FAD24
MPSLIRALGSIEARDEESGSPTLSTGAIIGVAVSGAFVLFVTLSLALICVSRWRGRRRQLAELAESGTTPSQGDSEDKSPFPRRLRKKSLLDYEGGPEEPDFQWHRISLPIIPPMNLAPFRDVHSSAGKSQRREKERGRELNELRRKSSWIDEDALHGPRISQPKSKRSLSSLRRKLSAKQPLNHPALMGSPTLPHAHYKTDTDHKESIVETHSTEGLRCSSSGTVLYRHRPAPPTANTFAQTSTTDLQPPPLAVTKSTKTTSMIAFEAAQQLAGKSRLPETQRPARNCTSATDLSAILQLTATRLQDGNRSPRRQTMFAASAARSSHQVVRFVDVHMADSDAGCCAPAVAELDAAAETTPQKGRPTPPPGLSQRSSHADRHVSQMSHVSQFSIVSEADSLVVSHRGSQPDVQTALSSPSRHERAREMALAEQQQQSRPSTSGSDSSALSTLYSVDEELEGSQACRRSMERTVDARTDSQSHERYDKSPKFPFENGGSPRINKLRRGTLGQFHGPRPMPRPESPDVPASPRDMFAKPLETSMQFSIYTVEDDPFIAESSPTHGSQRLSQIFKVVPGNNKRPDTGPKVRDSARSMKPKPLVLSPKTTGSPTPPAKSLRITLPPPYILRPGSPTRDIHGRRPSPSPSSRSGGSSEHENRISVASTVGYNTTTLLAIPTPEASPTDPEERPESRGGYRYDRPASPADDDLEDEERDVLRSMPRSRLFAKQSRSPSDGSVYSQQSKQEEEEEEEDQLPPLRHTTTKKSNHNNRDSAQMTSLVAELRRMNSQISQASSYSTASTASSNTLPAAALPADIGSPTLPALRGGGFSPGKKGGAAGASRNYLAVGGSPETKKTSSRDDDEGQKKRFSDSALVTRRQSHGRGAGGVSTARRARRGTVGAGMGSGSGLAGRLRELDRHMASVSAAAKTPCRSGAIRVRPEASGDSLYDEHGFLKSSPVARG